VTAGAEATSGRAVEARLIRGVLAGDEHAFRELYRVHARGLYLLALRLTRGVDADAEDVVQEAWRRAVGSLARFEGRSALRTWLGSIVVRCALEKNRANGRGPAASGVEPAAGAAEGRAFRRLDLERAFALLPEGFRTVLVLHDLEGYRHGDIAKLLGITEGTSKSQLSRARARMRELLGEDYARP
jgi:RNA polymerase sigma factor (sigma-70 family)